MYDVLLSFLIAWSSKSKISGVCFVKHLYINHNIIWFSAIFEEIIEIYRGNGAGKNAQNKHKLLISINISRNSFVTSR